MALKDSASFTYPIEKIEQESSKRGPSEEDEAIFDSNMEKLSYKLYPNPNDGNMLLEYELPENEAWFIMNDISGREISRLFLSEGKHTLPIKLANLENGIYLYRILKSNGAQVHTGKVVIIK